MIERNEQTNKVETIKKFISDYDSKYVCTSFQLPYENGKNAGVQQACKAILNFINTLS